MKLTERKKMILIHIAWILALAVILWPLFTIAKYDYPSADDWSFGKYMYRAMQAGEGIAGVFHAIYQTLAQNVWEARFSILILSALQPAAFGEHFYRITPYLMIGSVILSQFLHVDQMIKAGKFSRLRGLLYFTDGYGTFPVKMPPYDTAFVFMRDNYTDADVPPWAMKVILDPESMEDVGRVLDGR